jgi:hypothetical protein
MFITLICGLLSCNGDKNRDHKAAGLGLLSVNTQYPIPLYQREKDQIPVDTLRFGINETGSISFVSHIKLKPFRMSAGDSGKEGEKNVRQGLVPYQAQLKFCVIEAGETYFRVITNGETMETFVIKKDVNSVYFKDARLLDDNRSGANYNSRWYLYETWERYLKRVEYITKAKVMIYNTPEGKAIFENKSGAFLAFVVTDVKGEWIRIAARGSQGGLSPAAKKLEGWTQWRQGDKMLIDIIERSYE